MPRYWGRADESPAPDCSVQSLLQASCLFKRHLLCNQAQALFGSIASAQLTFQRFRGASRASSSAELLLIQAPVYCGAIANACSNDSIAFSNWRNATCAAPFWNHASASRGFVFVAKLQGAPSLSRAPESSASEGRASTPRRISGSVQNAHFHPPVYREEYTHWGRDVGWVAGQQKSSLSRTGEPALSQRIEESSSKTRKPRLFTMRRARGRRAPRGTNSLGQQAEQSSLQQSKMRYHQVIRSVGIMWNRDQCAQLFVQEIARWFLEKSIRIIFRLLEQVL